MEEVLPGPGEHCRLKTRDNKFWRFVNGTPFSTSLGIFTFSSIFNWLWIDIKEHVAITVMCSTASDSALAISIFAAQDLYYDVKPNAAVGIFT
jgi:hypothetical protein